MKPKTEMTNPAWFSSSEGMDCPLQHNCSLEQMANVKIVALFKVKVNYQFAEQCKDGIKTWTLQTIGLLSYEHKQYLGLGGDQDWGCSIIS